MMDPKHLLMFAKVVECGGITAAARVLGMPKATVSRAVAKIEKSLSTRLLERSSRKIRLTESGIVLFEHCRRIAEEIGHAEAAVGSLEGVARGKLKIAAPFTFGHFLLSPILPDFLVEHPEVQIELEVTNRRVDPIEEAFDLVVRVGAIEDSTMVAKTIGDVPFGLFASAKYLKHEIAPHRPADLERHALIGSLGSGERNVWLFVKGSEKESIRVVNARLDANDPMVRLDAALAGVGIALLPLWIARTYEKKGKLRRVLPEWESVTTTRVHVLYPSRRSLTPKSRVFVAFLEKRVPPLLAQEAKSAVET
jgi:LysR family transcriptional regulator, regulator for bpeEF and oprC